MAIRKEFYLVAFLMLTILIFGNNSFSKNLKSNVKTTTVRDAEKLDVNQISMWLMNNGSFARNPVTGNAGLEYPLGSDKYMVYTAGLWIAGKVNGEVRTSCTDYVAEYQGGIIFSNGQPADPTLEKYRLHKIKPGDSADPENPNYNPDYADWPVADGAPVDEYGNPLIIGDQTIWFVMNDANESLHAGAYNTSPLNIEVQVLAWAFDDELSPLERTVFFYYTIINKNSSPIEDAYIGLFADPDCGYANDDRAACDTSFGLSYDFNGDEIDEIFNLQVPAVGFCLLQGPAVPSPIHEAPQFLHASLENTQLLNMTVNMVYY